MTEGSHRLAQEPSGDGRVDLSPKKAQGNKAYPCESIRQETNASQYKQGSRKQDRNTPRGKKKESTNLTNEQVPTSAVPSPRNGLENWQQTLPTSEAEGRTLHKEVLEKTTLYEISANNVVTGARPSQLLAPRTEERDTQPPKRRKANILRHVNPMEKFSAWGQ